MKLIFHNSPQISTKPAALQRSTSRPHVKGETASLALDTWPPTGTKPLLGGFGGKGGRRKGGTGKGSHQLAITTRRSIPKPEKTIPNICSAGSTDRKLFTNRLENLSGIGNIKNPHRRAGIPGKIRLQQPTFENKYTFLQIFHKSHLKKDFMVADNSPKSNPIFRLVLLS